MSSALQLGSFKDLFRGNLSAKGKTLIDQNKKESGKLTSKNFLDKSTITNEDIQKHIQGDAGSNIGMMPITEEGKVYFGVIDVDSYTEDVIIYVKAIYRHHLPLIPFYSKSKGLHLYMFFKEGIKPAAAVDLLTEMRCMLGLPAKTEIFPKQRTAEKGGTYSWISLPYFDANNPENHRKMVKADLSLAGLDEALERGKASRRTVEEYRTILSSLPLSDAPPCLQSIYLKGATTARNDYLFSLAVYHKAKDEDSFDLDILDSNARLIEPLTNEEVESTIIKSHKRKTYTYKCNTPPLSLLCNKKICGEREFGIKSTTIASLSYEDFIQYRTDPPYYVWIINGMELKFFKESEIINQSAFRELCMRNLHVLPMKYKDEKWTSIVNQALQHVIIKETDHSEDISTGGVFRSHLNAYFTERVLAKTKKLIKMGNIYRDDDLKAFIFRGPDFLSYLRDIKSFKTFSDVEIQAKLKDLGCHSAAYDVGDGEIIKAYQMPISSIDTAVGDMTGIDIDFEQYLDKKQEGVKY